MRWGWGGSIGRVKRERRGSDKGNVTALLGQSEDLPEICSQEFKVKLVSTGGVCVCARTHAYIHMHAHPLVNLTHRSGAHFHPHPLLIINPGLPSKKWARSKDEVGNRNR